MKKLRIITKPKHDSKLYKLITKMTEDLREKDISEKLIKEYLTFEVKRIISEA